MTRWLDKKCLSPAPPWISPVHTGKFCQKESSQNRTLGLSPQAHHFLCLLQAEHK